MSVLPTQPVTTAIPAEPSHPPQCAIAPILLDELWRSSEAENCGLTRAGFEQIALRIGMDRNFGRSSALAAEATPAEQASFFASLRVPDLVLARACAGGNERAWERFLALYREPLLRAGIAITGNESLGRELADGLYAELYGLTVRDGERRCPLESYSGRGSLIGWLRTTLAQRHVDHHRRTRREEPMEETNDCPGPATPADTPDEKALPLLAAAVLEALDREGPEEKFLLAAYYLDGRKLHEIAAVLGVHEATVSRKLKRATSDVRKHVLRAMERRGLSRRAAGEALATDPRDLTAADVTGSIGADGTPPGGFLKLKELLQMSQPGPFKEQAES